ncbi:MAG: flagellar basal-body rod protein FlgG [Chromatiaceae bacterium]|nr:flagellar basal-body rod protein FlgG [Chromatiaceae bacterium]
MTLVRSLSTSKTGLEGQQANLDVIANNLANVSTNGFKRSRAAFADLLYQNLRQPGALNNIQDRLPSGLQVGTGVQTIAAVRVMNQGSVEFTNNITDMAIDGEGFFQVSMPDGTIAYTRDGNFVPNSVGDLVNANGYPLFPPTTVRTFATGTWEVGLGGVVSTQAVSNGPLTPTGQIELATFINPAGLQSIGGNLYRETESSGPPNIVNPQVDAGEIKHRFIENSNVSVVQEMVDMITTQRAYEVNSRAVQTSDEMLARLTQL